jgi:hypothetical protein
VDYFRRGPHFMAVSSVGKGGKMRKLAMATTIALLAFVAMLVQPAVAGGPLDEQKGFNCGVFDANGAYVITTNSHWIVYSSGKGVLTCNASGPAPASGKSFNVLGELCGGLDGRFTTQTKRRVSRNGDVQLVCTFDGAAVPTLARTSGGVAGNG